ncbi:MAG: hypothetical protein IPL49_12820 [Saprospirales bacterium]|nr:hypothetical protein [Saprospirales bacterium]MBK8491734.1 hypothetical protein [Saprospirales bacterium]
MLRRIQSSPLYLKLFVWEYWPMGLSIVPTVLFWLWFALRARRLFFFSAVNPAIETGGMMGESKIDIMRYLPEAHLPKTVFVPKDTPWEKIYAQMQEKGMSYPLIAKPNVGERGFQVLKVEREEMLREYHTQNQLDFLVQDFVGLPLEVSILYHRFPGQDKGAITSICLKEFLHVRGDGLSSIRDLMEQDPRANLQVGRFELEKPKVLNQVPAPGEDVLLEPIGNHCRGTKFLSGNHLIDPQLNAVFDRISQDMDGIHYGRFDMKVSSIEDLRKGNGFKILEYNGVSSDPAHIYDPAIPIWKKYRDIYRHWEIMFRIYRVQRRAGVRAMGYGEAWRAWKMYWAYKKSVDTAN